MKKFAALLAAFGAIASAPTVVSAAELQWSFDNEARGRINIEFYSSNRNHVWPGNGEVYYIYPNDGIRTMTLSCRQGEKICYGAWLDSNSNYYWGVGPGGKQGCNGCCYTCGGGSTQTIDLIP